MLTMAEDVSPLNEGLPTTRWSKVEAAARPASPEGTVALDVLLTLYRPLLLSFLRNRFSLNAPDAEDVLHDFVHHKVLSANLLAHASRSQGRFRNYIFSSLRNFATSELRQRHTRKRAPIQSTLPLDEVPEEDVPTVPTDTTENPSEHFWARAIIAGAMLDMRQHCTRRNQTQLWQLLVDRLIRPVLTEEEPLAYAKLVEQHRLDSPSSAFRRLHTAKRMFRRHLREVYHHFATQEREVQEDLDYLRRFIERLFSR